jgi:hypothetical protein
MLTVQDVMGLDRHDDSGKSLESGCEDTLLDFLNVLVRDVTVKRVSAEGNSAELLECHSLTGVLPRLSSLLVI